MAKKGKKITLYKAPTLTIEDRINYQLGKMNHRELKMACISRGMDFNKLIGASHHELASFFYKNFETSEDPTKLSEFDGFLEAKLKDSKADKSLFHPSLKYGFVTEEKIAEHKQIQNVEKVVAKPKEIPQKVEVDKTTGIRAGTKKNYTYQLVDEGKPVDKIISLVQKSFPDANASSIRIWFSRRNKELKELKGKSKKK